LGCTDPVHPGLGRGQHVRPRSRRIHPLRGDASALPGRAGSNRFACDPRARSDQRAAML